MTRLNPQVSINVNMSLDGTLLDGSDAFVITALLESDQLEEIHVTLHPILLGGVSARSITGSPFGFLSEERQFLLKGMESSDGIARLHYVRDRRKQT